MAVGVVLHGTVAQDLRELGSAGSPVVAAALACAGLCVAGYVGSAIGGTKELVLGVLAVDLGRAGVVLLLATLLSLGYTLGLLVAVNGAGRYT